MTMIRFGQKIIMTDSEVYSIVVISSKASIHQPIHHSLTQANQPAEQQANPLVSNCTT